MNEPKLNHEYRTVGGRRAFVRFKVTEPSAGDPYVGEIETPGRIWMKQSWRLENGILMCGFREYNIDLRPAQKPEWCKGNPAWARWQIHTKFGCFWSVDKPMADHSVVIFQDDRYGQIPSQQAPEIPIGCSMPDSLVEAPKGWGEM